MLALIIPLDGHLRPVDPGYGVDLPPGTPDQGLPGSPGHPSTGPVRPGRPVDPGFGIGPGYVWGILKPTDPGFGVDEGGTAGQLPNWPGYPTTGPVWPGRPVDPGFGVKLPAFWWPVDPGYGIPAKPPLHPDQELPAIPGVPDNTLPSTPPPTVPAGMILVIVRGPDGNWGWGTVTSMPTPLPVPPMVGGGPAPTPSPKS